LEDRNGLTAKQRDDAEVLKSKDAECVEVQVSCDEALVDVVEAVKLTDDDPGTLGKMP
jgi:hypothetical protein